MSCHARVSGMLALFLCAVFIIMNAGCQRFDPSFDHPSLVEVSKDGSKIAIYDSNNARVLLTDRDFNLIRVIESDRFYNLWGMTISDTGEIYLTNERASKTCFSEIERRKFSVLEILVFDFGGNLVREHAWYGEKGPVVTPGELRVLKDGSFLVIDSRNDDVVRFDCAGRPIGNFGKYGFAPGEMYYPNDLLVDSKNNIVEVDGYNSRMQVFDSDGKFIKVFAEKGTAEAQVMFPNFMCKDKGGDIYVTELYTMRISVFDKDYAFKRIIAPRKAGAGKERVGLYGIACASEPEALYVADSLNSCIYEFGLDGKLRRTVTEVKR
jgi:DNA-binding beta-propeller fold protein YncE